MESLVAPQKKEFNLVLVEDDARSIEAVQRILCHQQSFRLVEVFREITAATEGIPALAPDAVLMDIVFPESSGIQALQEIRARLPELKIVMLTAYEDTEYLFESLLAGATGYLLKSDPPEVFLRELGHMMDGGAPMSGAIARRVLQFFQRLGQTLPPEDELSSLSPRETQIVELLAKGCVAKEVAGHLGISPATARTHLKRIYKKLHVNSGSAAVAKFLKGKNILSRLFR